MAVIKMEQYEERPTLPVDSILHMKVQEVSVREVNGARGTWQKLEFKFKIMGVQASGDGSPVEYFDALVGTLIYGSVPFRFNDSAENKLKLWVEAILGMELAVGFELDTDLLEGKQVRGITATYDKKTNDPRTGQPFKGQQIDSLLPFGGSVLNQPAGGWEQQGSFLAPSAPAAAPEPAPQPAAVASGWGDDPPF